MTIAGKLWHLLTADQRRAALVLLVLMLVGMVLETLGVGLVPSTLALMTQIDVAARYPVLAPWLNRLGNPSREQLVIIGMLALVGVSVVKAVFLAYLTWWQGRFAFGIQTGLSQRFFAGYLRQPYVFHLQRNSAHLIRTTIGQVDEIRGVAQSAVTLGSELLVLVGIVALLVLVEPLGTLVVVITLGLSTWGFHRVTRDRILRWGEARQMHEGQRLQHLQQGLGGVKDVKLLGREADFLHQYGVHNTGNSRVGLLQSLMQALPKLWLELLAVIGLATVVFVMIGQGKPLDTLLPTLGLFAAAAFRLMPSLIRVINTVQTVRFSAPVVDTLFGELPLLDATESPRRGPLLPFRSTIRIDDVSFRYATADSPAVRGIDLEIAAGTSTGFVGTTGAGKSTLVDVVLGLLTPTAGAVRVDGIDIQTNLRGWQDQIGYVPQSVFLTDDSLRRNVAFGLAADQIDDAAVWRAIRAAQLEPFVNDLPRGLETMVGERGVRLSGGERQRIGIARALYHDPSVLVLDEATSSLDTATEAGVMEAVRALHGTKTVLIVAHRLSTVEHCDHVFRLEKGQVVEHGDTATLLRPGRLRRAAP